MYVAVKTKISVTKTAQVFKERNIRLYSNICKTIHNYGPYKLSSPFKHQDSLKILLYYTCYFKFQVAFIQIFCKHFAS